MENIDNKVINDLLKNFQPILVIYFPDYYLANENFLRVEALKNKLMAGFEDKYEVLAIPYPEDSFSIDLLSVVKSRFILDNDLKNHLNRLQKEIFQTEKNKLNKYKNVADFETALTNFNTRNGE